LRLSTADIGAISVNCTPVTFIVSKNNDNALETVEDNGRRFDFSAPGAIKVLVAEPEIRGTGNTAVPSRVKGWKDSQMTQPFVFNRFHNIPAGGAVTMYLEGKKTSSSINDIVFEIQFNDANNQTVCGQPAQGTVVEVNPKFNAQAGGGSRFSAQNKMLIRGRGNVKATVRPNIPQETEWTYGPYRTTPFADASVLETTFDAPERITRLANIDQHRVKFTLRARGVTGRQTIEGTIPVNLTAPVRLSLPNNRRIAGRPTNFVAPRKNGSLSLINVRFRYVMLDQTGEPIRRSAYAGCAPVTRENIGDPGVLVSIIPQLNNYIRRNLRHTPKWKIKRDGRINDTIRVFNVKNSLITFRNSSTGGQRRFANEITGWNPVTRRFHPIGRILMQVATGQSHIWVLGVKDREPNQRRSRVFSGRGHTDRFRSPLSSFIYGSGFPPATRNRFHVRTIDFRLVGAGTSRNPHLRFSPTYTVHLQ